MPVLKNPKYELFAQEIANGVSALQAYVNVGFKYDRGNCSRLHNRNIVKQRVNELLEQRQKKAEIATERAVAALSVDRKWVLSKLVQNAEQALENNDRSAANRALELIGKEQGMFIDRRETGQPGDFGSLQSIEEIMARVRLDLGDQAAGALASIMAQLSPPAHPQAEQATQNSSDISSLLH